MSSSKGWAVRTLNKLEQGRFICEYAGEVISTAEAQRRWREEHDPAGHNYLLVVREFMYAFYGSLEVGREQRNRAEEK